MPTQTLDSAPSVIRKVRSVAVIDIGTSSIRMAIAEIDDSGGVRILANLSQAVSLGKDTFTQGYIGKATIEECVRVLKDYGRVLDEYQIDSADQIRTVATSAVREARNRLAFIDRIYIATGLQVVPIDEAEENRITYLGVQPFLQTEPDLASAMTIVIEVGGGSTEVLAVQKDDVAFSTSYRLGSLRLRRMLEAYQTPTAKVRKIMENQIGRAVQRIQADVTTKRDNREMIALGGDVRFAARQLLPGWNPGTLARIPLVALEEFTNEVLRMSQDELVSKFHISFPEADTLGPALLAYVQLAKSLDLVNVLVTNTNLRDGLLKEMAVQSAWTEEFSNQIVRSAINLGRKYDFNERHARHVAELAKRLFHEIQDEHKLEQRYEVLLYVAALLHEIGLFVSYQSHHKHSMYLIKNSELFGLGRRELLLTALVARYYRRASPQPNHEGYSTMDRNERVAVAKMAAILRVAVALAESRSGRIKEFSSVRDGARLVISVPGIDDLSIEQLAIRQSGSLFEEIFGLRVLLRSVRT